MRFKKKEQFRVSRNIGWEKFTEAERDVWTRWFEDRGFPAEVVREFTILRSGDVQVDVYHEDADGRKHVCGHCDGSVLYLNGLGPDSKPRCAVCGTSQRHNDACRYLAYVDGPHPPLPKMDSLELSSERLRQAQQRLDAVLERSG